MNKQEKLSEHFTLEELTKTIVKLDNVPNEAQVKNLKRLCRWLEQLRKRWNDKYGGGNDPIIINSGFRSPEVNKSDVSVLSRLFAMQPYCWTSVT